MENLLSIIQLIIWIATAVGLYYRMKNDIALSSAQAKTDNETTCLAIKLANERIDKMEQDRNARWCKYTKEQTTRRNEYSNDQKEQNAKLAEIALGIARIQVDIKYLKEKK